MFLNQIEVPNPRIGRPSNLVLSREDYQGGGFFGFATEVEGDVHGRGVTDGLGLLVEAVFLEVGDGGGGQGFAGELVVLLEEAAGGVLADELAE